MKNTKAKTRKVDKPYEIWETISWEWRVLKKWQVDDDKEYARWYCAVKSPFTYGSWEYGDVYVKDIKENAVKTFDETWGDDVKGTNEDKFEIEKYERETND